MMMMMINLQGLFNGQLEHTEYPNLQPGVLRLMAFVGIRDGCFSVMITIIKIMVQNQTTQGHWNSTLMEK